MVFKKLFYFIAIFIVALFCSYIFQQRKIGKGYSTSVKYELVKDWLKLTDSMLLGNPTGIGIDTSQNIFIFHRGRREWNFITPLPGSLIEEKTILMVDKESGKIINSWGANLFIMPHGLTVDNDNNVWVTDVGLHQVFKFNHDGQLLMKIGEAKVPGNDSKHFNKPTDVAIAKNGSFYVSDGYGNSRIIKFSANGKYLFEWGKKGNKQGEFNIPHGIDIDNDGNIFVADRENYRMQVFDSSGKFIKQLVDENYGNICAITIDKKSRQVFTVDDLSFLKMKHRGSDFIIIDSVDKIQTRQGRSGSYNGTTCWYHDIAIDKEQNVYVCDILGNRVQKFRKILLR